MRLFKQKVEHVVMPDDWEYADPADGFPEGDPADVPDVKESK